MAEALQTGGPIPRPGRSPASDPMSRRLQRLEVACDGLGIEAPPCWVCLKTGPPPAQSDSGGFFVRTLPGNARRAREWLLRTGSVASALAQDSSNTLHSRIVPSTIPWGYLFDDLAISHMELTASGYLSMATPEPRRFMDSLRGMRRNDRHGSLDAHVRRFYADDRDVLEGITPRQREVVFLAVARGYYRVPRRVNLRGLANNLRLSLAATSELLRRAESTIVKSFADQSFLRCERRAMPRVFT